MVFGRKKKNKTDKKNESKKPEAKFNSRKVKRRASYVSTPLRNKKPTKKRKSLTKNSFVKKRVSASHSKQAPREKPKGQAMVQNIHQNGKHVQGQGQQKLQVPHYRYRPANIPPPPPPPGNANRTRPNKKPNQVQSQFLNGRPSQKQNKSGENHRTATPAPPRVRTASDVTRWLQWRRGVNDHLANYVLSEGHRQQDTTSLANFPKDFTADTIDAILYHAYTRESPKSSLDKLSYMIYGIPRVRLPVKARQQDHRKVIYSHDSSYAESFSDGCPYTTTFPQLPTQVSSNNDISRCSSQISGGRLPRREVRGNLFIQTNPPSNIQRFLPDTRPENPYRGSNEGQEVSSHVSRSSSKSCATYHPEPHSPISTRGKPPVVGAVPTLLSGLQPYEMAQLRPVPRHRRY